MKFVRLAILALGITTVSAFAGMGTEISALQDRWAEVNYELPEKKRSDAFEALAEQAEALVLAEPANAEAHIWTGIIYSTWAGNSGPFGAMKRAKKAKLELESALEISPEALDGSAYTSLGALLYQIPGIMGGDDAKAEAYLLKGLELNPRGIDANYFYATFLVDQRRYEEAERYLEVASKAPNRPGRVLADEGRRGEITELRKQVLKKLN